MGIPHAPNPRTRRAVWAALWACLSALLVLAPRLALAQPVLEGGALSTSAADNSALTRARPDNRAEATDGAENHVPDEPAVTRERPAPMCGDDASSLAAPKIVFPFYGPTLVGFEYVRRGFGTTAHGFAALLDQGRTLKSFGADCQKRSGAERAPVPTDDDLPERTRANARDFAVMQEFAVHLGAALFVELRLPTPRCGPTVELRGAPERPPR